MSSLGRALGVLRTGSQLLRRSTQKITTRKAGDGPHIEPQYRAYPQITKNQKFQSELLSGAMWFWILWHCWHDPDAVMVSKRVVLHTLYTLSSPLVVHGHILCYKYILYILELNLQLL
uniref:NADH dehydrogenase [ubiquinone] 1 beta subcomplex subunit 2, mitochondrial n=1 Tax=Cyclopterus lumpus TaxID=8103 RepID=A0A8C3GBY1_CYCLU